MQKEVISRVYGRDKIASGLGFGNLLKVMQLLQPKFSLKQKVDGSFMRN